MPIIPPAASVYAGSLNAGPINRKGDPPEGLKAIPIAIDWNVIPTLAVVVNIQSTSVVTITRIRTLFIDNSDCWYDLAVYFSDTQQKVEVAAGQIAYVPIITNLLFFNIWLTQVLPGDPSLQLGATNTYMNVLNYDVDPIVIEVPQDNWNVIHTEFNVLTVNVPNSVFSWVRSPVAQPIIVSDLFVQLNGSISANSTLDFVISDYQGNPKQDYYFLSPTPTMELVAFDWVTLTGVRLATPGLTFSVVTGTGTYSLTCQINTSWQQVRFN